MKCVEKLKPFLNINSDKIHVRIFLYGVAKFLLKVGVV